MTSFRPGSTCAAIVVAAAALAGISFAQMEKRGEVFYDAEAFRNAAPAVGTVVPELVLADLEGRPVALSSYRGRALILVSGGYT